MRRSLFVFALVASSRVFAATYTVTSTDNDGPGTLRQAILDANANSGPDAIAFAISGTGVHTIAPTSTLPYIEDALVIDGYTQPGSQPNTNPPAQGGLNGVLAIELSGANLPPYSSYGLYTAHADVTIRGLVMNGFWIPVELGNSYEGAPNFDVAVEGCYLGTNASGTAAVGSNQSVAIDGLSQVQAHLTVGGTDAASRNLISGFVGDAARFAINVKARLGGPVVRGNLIGTDASGTHAIANQRGIGIVQSAVDANPAGAMVKDNVISGNLQGAILVNCGQTCMDGFALTGNMIGVGANGATLPNGDYGIRFDVGNNPATHIVVGGETEQSQNAIAWNGGRGIIMANNTQGTIEIARNRIFANTGLDIDLPNPENGRNPNDAHDSDGFGLLNRLQNYPVIVSVSQAGNQLTVRYKVPTATTFATYPLTVRFYRAAASGGDRWLADDVYDAVDAELEKQVVVVLPAGVSAFKLIATAADAVGNTSEFSDPFVFGDPDLIFANGFEP